MARARKGGGRTKAPTQNLKVAAIVFVSLSVALLGVSIVLYTELRKQWEEVVKAERQLEKRNQEWQKQLERAEELAMKSMGDRDGTAEGMNDTLNNLVVLDPTVEGKPEHLTDLVTKLRSKVNSLKERKIVLKEDLDDSKRKYSQKIKEMEGFEKNKEEEISRLRQELENEKSSAKRMIEDYEEKVRGLKEETRTLRTKVAEMTKGHKREIARVEVQRDNWKEKYFELVEKQRQKVVAAYFEFDGKILNVDDKFKRATINLGSREGIRPGHGFIVYPPGKPHEEDIKGRVEVKQVMDNISVVKILEDNEKNPIMAGDQLHSPVYSATQKETFVLVGDFESPYTSERITELIRDHGGKMVKQVNDSTNYVVLGSNYEHTEDFKKARELGIEVLRVKILQKFFGIR